MAWEYYVEPIPEGGIVTPKMVRELWEAFDERLRAVYDAGSGVDFGQSPEEYISTRIVYDANGTANDGNTQNTSLGGAVNGLAQSRYVHKAEGVWRTFDSTGPNRVLELAATALGYSGAEAEQIVLNATNASFRVRSRHVFNVIRKALQLMTHPLIRRVDFSLNPGIKKNAIDTSSEGEIRSGSHESAWESAKDDFFSETWTEGKDDAASIARIIAAQGSNCGYSVGGQRYRAAFDLASVWGKGYELYLQHQVPEMISNETFESGDLKFGLASEPKGSRTLTTPGELYVDKIVDHFTSETPPLQSTIEVDLEPSEVRAELDSWTTPTHAHCDSVTDRRILVTKIPFPKELIFGRIGFDYGDDPE